jgi:hypothetical protein
MDKVTYAGDMNRTDFYLVLEAVDSLKCRGWSISKRERRDYGDRVEFAYELEKGAQRLESPRNPDETGAGSSHM